MITPQSTLLCIFSYNMGATLQNCLDSIAAMCPGFQTVVFDDNSEDPETLRVIEQNRYRLYDAFTNKGPKGGKRHGNLYQNIQTMMDHARERGFRYLFMLQDDMQFVRPLSPDVCRQYDDIFASDQRVIQVDPRFLRRGNYEIVPHNGGYRHGPETSYADVGITDLERLGKTGWRMTESERRNQQQLAELGLMRLFPFTPVVMHVPFPNLFRQGRRKIRPFPFNRGHYRFHYMTDTEIKAMDSRPLSEPPFFRKHLRPKNMRLSHLLYVLRKDSKVFT